MEEGPQLRNPVTYVGGYLFIIFFKWYAVSSSTRQANSKQNNAAWYL